MDWIQGHAQKVFSDPAKAAEEADKHIPFALRFVHNPSMATLVCQHYGLPDPRGSVEAAIRQRIREEITKANQEQNRRARNWIEHNEKFMSRPLARRHEVEVCEAAIAKNKRKLNDWPNAVIKGFQGYLCSAVQIPKEYQHLPLADYWEFISSLWEHYRDQSKAHFQKDIGPIDRLLSQNHEKQALKLFETDKNEIDHLLMLRDQEGHEPLGSVEDRGPELSADAECSHLRVLDAAV